MRHLTRKRKANKKIIITNRQRGHESHSPKVQSVEEISNNILQGSLQILRAPIILLPPNSPKKASRHHFPYCCTPCTWPSWFWLVLLKLASMKAWEELAAVGGGAWWRVRLQRNFDRQSGQDEYQGGGWIVVWAKKIPTNILIWHSSKETSRVVKGHRKVTMIPY
jgi:hypothetical protein